jgi:hypothetical protein
MPQQAGPKNISELSDGEEGALNEPTGLADLRLVDTLNMSTLRCLK